MGLSTSKLPPITADAGESKSVVPSLTTTPVLQLDPSSLFVIQTLFNTQSISPGVLQLYKDALRLFSVSHVRYNSSTGKLEKYGQSFRNHQMAHAARWKLEGVFDYILKSAVTKLGTSKIYKKVYFSKKDNAVTFIQDANNNASCQLNPELQHDIEQWSHSDKLNLGIFRIQEKRQNDRHATLLVLYKKQKKNVATLFQYFYFDPHGGAASHATSALLQPHLKALLGRHLYERALAVTCPSFQTAPQGGNCAMWMQLFCLCLVTNPDLLSFPETVEQKLAANPDANIMLYELFCFFVGMAIVPNYIDNLLTSAPHSSIVHPTFYKMLDAKIGVENCHSMSRQTSQQACESVAHCRFYQNSCWFNDVNTRFHVYKKLVTLYQTLTKEHLLPISVNIELNLQTSYTPLAWEVAGDTEQDVWQTVLIDQTVSKKPRVK